MWLDGSNISRIDLVMTWYYVGTKPLSKPMMAKFIDTYMYH